MADSTALSVFIIVFLLSRYLRDHKAAAQTSLSSSVEFPVCPGQEVVLTCTGDETALTWMVAAQAGNSFQGLQNYVPTSPVNVPANHTFEGNLFEAILTSTDPLTSTLTTTADTTLDGTVVQCASETVETLTLQVTMIVAPPSPTRPTSIVAGQTAGTTSATVTVQWGASTGADSYTVSITPAISEPVTVAGRMTSLILEDVLFNTTYTVSIVARNCAGSSAAESVTFTIVPCVVPDSPVNGDWLQFSSSETVWPGTGLSLSCNPGHEPSEVMASTCQSDGSWEPYTAQLECTPSLIDCGPPTLASGVVLEAPVSSITISSTFSFRCEEGLIPNTAFEAVCGADGQWSPDPANRICRDESTEQPCSIGGSKFELSTGSAVAITAVLCSVVFFILGTMAGILIYYCITAKRAQYSVSSSSTEPQTPAPDPLYDDITATDAHPKAIELSENIAYGSARR